MKNSTKNNLPFVSIIIPCRHEEKFIGRCLDSVVANEYPEKKLEILVVDGMSEDGTRKIVKEYIERFPIIHLLDNIKKSTSSAFNKGIEAAKGEIIMIMGAHSIYKDDYISQCVDHLIKGDADNVGGVCKILPQNNSLIAESISYALSSSFGAGNAYYRIGAEETRYVDTVFGGCYKKKIFDDIGCFDEDLLRTQDSELNARLIKSGGKILLVPTIISYYYARKSLGELFRMNLQYGYSKPLAVTKVGKVYTIRQLIPPAFIASLGVFLILSLFFNWCFWPFLLILASYTITNLAFSLKISQKKGLKYFFVLPLVFATLHFSYGIGYLKGVWDFIIFADHKKRKGKDIPLTR
ncbi:MAG: glycosyltransferase family 2 protein [Planctomycetota bacterium]|jgi:glycosyltransferase involved in cell wall biosynthesis